jgi:PadR family transcriptional regulator PadR
VISSDVMRGFNSLILLSILMKEDSYGYQISNTIKEITDGKYIMKETTL